MTWEEKIKQLEETSLQEIELKIFEHNNKVSNAAIQALNEIRWVIRTADSDKEAVTKVREIEEKFHELDMSGVKFHLEKIRKEKLMEDPEGFKNMMKSLSEVSESLKEDSEDNQ